MILYCISFVTIFIFYEIDDEMRCFVIVNYCIILVFPKHSLQANPTSYKC